MPPQRSHDHHTVPKLYLRGFCGTMGSDRNVVLAHYRNGADDRLTIKRATVEVNFYDIGDDATRTTHLSGGLTGRSRTLSASCWPSCARERCPRRVPVARRWPRSRPSRWYAPSRSALSWRT
jgi:hypothetical protein